MSAAVGPAVRHSCFGFLADKSCTGWSGWEVTNVGDCRVDVVAHGGRSGLALVFLVRCAKERDDVGPGAIGGGLLSPILDGFGENSRGIDAFGEGSEHCGIRAVSYTHLTLPTIYSV